MPGPFSLPVPLSPGESAVALLTTNGQFAFSSGGGTLTAGPSSGTLTRTGSSPTSEYDMPGWIFWNQLASVAGAMVLGHALNCNDYAGGAAFGMTKIYGVALVDFNGILGVEYLEYSKQGGDPTSWPFGTIDGELYGAPGAITGQVSVKIADGTTTPTAANFDLNMLKFRLRNEASISYAGPPDEVMTVSAIGVVVYFTGVQSMAAGFTGSGFAPGHGILITQN